LHAQIKFYEFSKFTEQEKLLEQFLKKNTRGPDLPETGRGERIRPRSHVAAALFEPASGAWLSAAPDGRIGMRHRWPSD
jgi:hypothetical protein